MRSRRILTAEPNHADAGTSGRRRGRRRVGRRIAVNALVTINADRGTVKATACDVSETGVRIVMDDPPPPGPISVKMVGLPIFAGEVRWRDTNHIGVLLRRPIESEFLAAWIYAHGNIDCV